MRGPPLLGFVAAPALGISLSSALAQCQQPSLRDQLIGTWSANSWIQAPSDGPRCQGYGANPRGITTFDSRRRFFAMWARPDLPATSLPKPPELTSEEATTLLAGAVGYCGRFDI